MPGFYIFWGIQIQVLIHAQASHSLTHLLVVVVVSGGNGADIVVIIIIIIIITVIIVIIIIYKLLVFRMTTGSQKKADLGVD